MKTGIQPYIDRGFESHRGHGCLSVVCVVCCQVEVSATDWSLVQRSPTDCGASLYVIKKPRKTRRLKPVTGLWKIQPQWVVTPGKQTNKHIYITIVLKKFCHAFHLALCFIYQGTRFLVRLFIHTFILFNNTAIHSEYTPSKLLVE
jgi:hypothetical protein